MDPLSITSGCVGILGAIVKTSTTIHEFVRDVRDARGQLSATAQQLAELEMTIGLIKDDHNTSAEHMPDSVINQTAAVIQSCRDVLGELDTVMAKYSPRRHRTPVQWALKGRDEVAALNKQLEAHSRTLQMSLEISTLVVSKSIKSDTVALGVVSSQIRDDTGQIRDDTQKILHEIDKLRALVSRQLPDHIQSRIDIIGNYLDSLTEYAETGVDSNEYVSDHSPPSFDGSSDENPRQDNGCCRADVCEVEQSRPSPGLDLAPTQPPTKKVVDPAQPVSLLLLGPTRNAKIAFINRLIDLATNDARQGRKCERDPIYLGGITLYDLEIPLSDYVLVDGAGEERLWSATAHEPAGWQVRLRHPDAPTLKLHLIEGPLYARNCAIEYALDVVYRVRHPLVGFCEGSPETWEGRSNYIALFNGPLDKTEFRADDKTERHLGAITSLFSGCLFIDTNHPDDWKRFLNPRCRRWVQPEAKGAFGAKWKHFTLFDSPKSANSELMACNTVHAILCFLKASSSKAFPDSREFGLWSQGSSVC